MKFGILGPLTVSDGDRSLDVGGPKQRAVLAMLIAHVGRPIGAETIAQAVYGRDVPDSGRRRVQTYVSTLRSILGDVIVKKGPGWFLDVDPTDVDSVRFEEEYEAARSLDPAVASEPLREALALWRGLPYSDIESHGVLEAEITRLNEVYVSAQHARIAADLDLGRDADLIGDIEALLADYPYQERFRGQHMLALYRAGRQTEALRSYQQIRGLLVNELGVEPTPELRDLELRILDQDDSLLLVAPPGTYAGSVAEPRPDVRYTTTEDGVGIAYWELGSGPPLVLVHQLSYNHLEAEWAVPSIAALYVALAERYRLVRLNWRGMGMSENPFPRFGTTPAGAQLGMTTRDMGLDIAAVASACGLDRFTLMACGPAGPVAIEYAADHPDQVAALVLCEAVSAIVSSWIEHVTRKQIRMAQLTTELGHDITMSGEGLVPSAERQERDKLTSLAVRQTGAEDTASVEAFFEWDARSRLPDVVATTVVLTGRSLADEPEFFAEARALATGIPGAQLRVVDGFMAPYNVDRAAMLDAIDAIHRQIAGPADGQ